MTSSRVPSTRPRRPISGKLGKLFNGSQNHLQLLFSHGWILCQDEVIRGRKLF